MTTDSVPAHDEAKITDEQRWAAEDAVRFAMEGAEGGAVPSIPRGHGARAWGEADGYWITMHVGPVLDALIKLGWGPDQSSLLASARADGEVLTEIVTQIDQAIYANEDGGEYQWRNAEVLEMLRGFRAAVPLTEE
jgi:hypothetical protein